MQQNLSLTGLNNTDGLEMDTEWNIFMVYEDHHQLDEARKFMQIQLNSALHNAEIHVEESTVADLLQHAALLQALQTAAHSDMLVLVAHDPYELIARHLLWIGRLVEKLGNREGAVVLLTGTLDEQETRIQVLEIMNNLTSQTGVPIFWKQLEKLQPSKPNSSELSHWSSYYQLNSFRRPEGWGINE